MVTTHTILTGPRAVPDNVIVSQTGKSSADWNAILYNFGIYKYETDLAVKFLCAIYKLSAWWAQTLVMRYEWESGLRTEVILTPDDLVQALQDAGLLTTFEAMAYSHRHEYIEWIEESIKPKTRQRRIQKTLERIGEL